MAVVGLGQLSFRQGSEETRAVCAGHMCSEVSTGDRRACARSPPPWQFPLVWSAQQTCPGKSKDKRRLRRRLRRGPCPRATRCGPHHPPAPIL